MIRESVWLLGKTVPWYSGEIREALHISSENLLGHIVIPRPLRQSPGLCWWPLIRTQKMVIALQGDISRFYSNFQLSSNWFILALPTIRFRFWLGTCYLWAFLSSGFLVVEIGVVDLDLHLAPVQGGCVCLLPGCCYSQHLLYWVEKSAQMLFKWRASSFFDLFWVMVTWSV